MAILQKIVGLLVWVVGPMGADAVGQVGGVWCVHLTRSDRSWQFQPMTNVGRGGAEATADVNRSAPVWILSIFLLRS